MWDKIINYKFHIKWVVIVLGTLLVGLGLSFYRLVS